MVEHHELDCDQSVVICTDIFHVAVDLRWNVAEFSKLQFIWNEASWVGAIRPMPYKIMQPVNRRGSYLNNEAMAPLHPATLVVVKKRAS